MAFVLAMAFCVLSLQLGLQACGPAEEDFDAGDEGTDAATAPTCADYVGTCTQEDACDGDLLLYCDGNTQRCDDCAALTGGPFHCARFSVQHGNDCLAGQGQACSPDFPNNLDDLVGCDPAIGTCTGGTCN
jgi:hypothetical protein